MAKMLNVRPSLVRLAVRLVTRRKIPDGTMELVLRPLEDEGHKKLSLYKGSKAILRTQTATFGLTSVRTHPYMWTCSAHESVPDTATLELCNGKGLFANSNLSAGIRFPYKGVFVTPDQISSTKHNSYLLTVSSDKIIDGQGKQGLANYCNHGGSKANAFIDIDSATEGPKGTVRVDAVTIRPILAGEEILLDYNGGGDRAPHTRYFPDDYSPNLADAVAFDRAHSTLTHEFEIGDHVFLVRGVRDDESRSKHKKWHPSLDADLSGIDQQKVIFLTKTGLPSGCTWRGERLSVVAKNKTVTLPLPKGIVERNMKFNLCAPDGKNVGDGVELMRVRVVGRFAPHMYIIDLDGHGTCGYAEGRSLISACSKENVVPSGRSLTKKRKKPRSRSVRSGDRVVVAAIRDPTTKTYTASYEGRVAWVRPDGRLTVASSDGVFVDSGVDPEHITLRDGGDQKRHKGIAGGPLRIPPLVVISAMQRGGERRLIARAGGRTRWIGPTAYRNGWLRNGVRVAWVERGQGKGWVYRSGTLRGHRAPFSVWRDDYPASGEHYKNISKKKALSWRLNYVEWLGAARSCPSCGVSGSPCTKECRKAEVCMLARYFGGPA